MKKIMFFLVAVGVLGTVSLAFADTASSTTSLTATTTATTTTTTTTTSATSTASSTSTTVASSTATSTSTVSPLDLIKNLFAQIENLKNQIVQILIQNLANNQISVSSTKTLQSFLSDDKEIYPEGLVTGYPGPLTKRAAERYLEKHGLATSSDGSLTGPARLLEDGAGNSGHVPPGLLHAPGLSDLRESLGISATSSEKEKADNNNKSTGQEDNSSTTSDNNSSDN